MPTPALLLYLAAIFAAGRLAAHANERRVAKMADAWPAGSARSNALAAVVAGVAGLAVACGVRVLVAPVCMLGLAAGSLECARRARTVRTRWILRSAALVCAGASVLPALEVRAVVVLLVGTVAGTAINRRELWKVGG